MIQKHNDQTNYRRHFQIAGITICVESDIIITASTFHPKFKKFSLDRPENSIVYIRHHFSLPDLNQHIVAEEIYSNPPWRIYRDSTGWIYKVISPEVSGDNVLQIAIFNESHTHVDIYHATESAFRSGNAHSLTLFPTDQILLARVLADHDGAFVHASGAIIEEKGFLFAGHSGSGKSTVVTNLAGPAEILCDDRIIIRKLKSDYRICGTWSHGDIPVVSSNSAELKAILFLEQSGKNSLVFLDNHKEIITRLLALLVKPLVTSDWWEKMLSFAEKIVQDIPCYILRFKKNADLTDVMRSI